MRRFEIMVPVFINIVAMRWIDIKPRIIRQVRTIRIEFVHRIETCCMIKHHVQNNRHTTFVALVNELFEHLRCPVCFIQSKIVIR